MKSSFRLSATACLAVALWAQPGAISTVVGESPLGDGGPATQASLFFPSHLSLHESGDLYFIDSQGYRIRRVTAAGRIDTVIGSGFWPFVTGQTSVVAARVPSAAVEATALAVGTGGEVLFATRDLYCTEPYAPRTYIMALTRAGELRQVAGGGCGTMSRVSLAAVGAPLGTIDAIAVGRGGELYLAERERSRILRVDGASIRVFAETGFRTIAALVASPDGSVYAADPALGRIWRVGSDGAARPAAEMAGVRDIAVGPAGEVYASAVGPIRRVTGDGLLETVVDGLHIDFTVDQRGRFFSHGDSSQIWRHRAGAETELVAGIPVSAAETRTPATARTLFLHQTKFGPGGDLWFWDLVGLRRLRPDGVLEPPIERGAPVFAIDERGALFLAIDGGIERVGPDGVRSRYVEPATLDGRTPEYMIAAGGKLYLSVPAANEVYAVPSPNRLELVAGTAVLDNPRDLAADGWGNLYISTRRAVRRVEPSGEVTTVLGSPACTTARPEPGGSVEGLCFANQSIDVDRVGNLFATVRHFDPGKYGSYRSEFYRVGVAGRVQPLLSGETGFSGDGVPAWQARQAGIGQIAVHPSGSVYFIANERIRRIAGEAPFSVSPEGLRMAAGAPPAAITVTAGPGGVRTFRVRIAYGGTGVGWLSATPTEGRLVPGESATVRIGGNGGGLGLEPQYARIVVEDSVSGERVEIPVSF